MPGYRVGTPVSLQNASTRAAVDFTRNSAGFAEIVRRFGDPQRREPAPKIRRTIGQAEALGRMMQQDAPCLDVVSTLA